MTETAPLNRANDIERLLRNKLRTLPDWKPPQIIKTVGPFDPKIFDDILEKRNRVCAECRRKLENYTDSEFRELLASDNINPNRFGREWEYFKEPEIDRMTGTEPSWYAAGFGHPDYVADFVYWSQATYYTVHEAVFLSLGVEPEHFTENQVESMEVKVAKGTKLWPALHYMLRRREQFRRQFLEKYGTDRIYPKDLFGWFTITKLEVHPNFTSRFVEYSREVSEENQPPKRPHKRELDTIAQLFTLMAMEYYGYHPQDKRSPTPKEIVDAAASHGIEISDDTVRKYLRLGASFIVTSQDD